MFVALTTWTPLVQPTTYNLRISNYKFRYMDLQYYAKTLVLFYYKDKIVNPGINQNLF